MRDNKYYPYIIITLLCLIGVLIYLDRMSSTTMSSNMVESIPINSPYLWNNSKDESWKEEFFTNKNIWLSTDEKQ